MAVEVPRCSGVWTSDAVLLRLRRLASRDKRDKSDRHASCRQPLTIMIQFE